MSLLRLRARMVIRKIGYPVTDAPSAYKDKRGGVWAVFNRRSATSTTAKPWYALPDFFAPIVAHSGDYTDPADVTGPTWLDTKDRIDAFAASHALKASKPGAPSKPGAAPGSGDVVTSIPPVVLSPDSPAPPSGPKPTPATPAPSPSAPAPSTFPWGLAAVGALAGVGVAYAWKNKASLSRGVSRRAVA